MNAEHIGSEYFFFYLANLDPDSYELFLSTDGLILKKYNIYKPLFV